MSSTTKQNLEQKKPPQVVTTPGAEAEKNILQTMYHERRRLSMPYEDIQQKPLVAACDHCGDGLNEYEAEPDEWGHLYCPECRKALSPMHETETVAVALEAYDREVKKYLTKDICDAIWNTVIKRFPGLETGT